jgi:hypothetical protein
MHRPFRGIFLTGHAQQRTWERRINPVLLEKILSQTQIEEKGKTIVIVTPAFISNTGTSTKDSGCLVLIFHRKALTTTFWNPDPVYLFKKEEKSVTFKLLY